MPFFVGFCLQSPLYGMILVIQGHLQGQKVISKVKNLKISSLRIKIRRSAIRLFGVI